MDLLGVLCVQGVPWLPNSITWWSSLVRFVIEKRVPWLLGFHELQEPLLLGVFLKESAPWLPSSLPRNFWNLQRNMVAKLTARLPPKLPVQGSGNPEGDPGGAAGCVV